MTDEEIKEQIYDEFPEHIKACGMPRVGIPADENIYMCGGE